MPGSRSRKERRRALQLAGTESTVDEAKSSIIDADFSTSNVGGNPISAKLECNPEIQIRAIEGKGRGLVYCPADGKVLKKGTTLMRLQPDIMVPLETELSSVCHVCYAKFDKNNGRKELVCSDCGIIRYCSATCKYADELGHGEECKALVSYRKANGEGLANSFHDPGAKIRMIGRLVWERKRRDETWWNKIESLVTNPEGVESSDEDHIMIERLAEYLCGAVSGFDQDREAALNHLGFTRATLNDLYGCICINFFDAYNQKMRTVGLSLSITTALLNHSCEPNVIAVCPNGLGVKDSMHVVNIRDLKPGEELVVACTSTILPYNMRQGKLQLLYNFTCRCSLCIKSEKMMQNNVVWVDPFQALLCGRSDCLGWLATCPKTSKPLGLCTECKQPYKMNELLVRSMISEGKDLWQLICSSNQKDNLSIIRKKAPATLKLLTAIQPPSAFPLLPLLMSIRPYLKHLSRLLGIGSKERNSYTEEAIRFTLLLIEAFQAIKAEDRAKTGSANPYLAYFLADLSLLLLRPQEPVVGDEAFVPPISASVHLTRVPSIPLADLTRTELGIKYGDQALEELKIVYGSTEGGGDLGRRVKKEVTEWKAIVRQCLHR